MYRLDRHEFVKARLIPLWGVLGFQAGFLNAFGFLACGRFVSHVTGFGTQIGIALASHDAVFAVELLGIPLSFIVGAFVSGLITSARKERGLKPRFDAVTALLPVMVMVLLVGGFLGGFGRFGEPLVEPRDFALLFLLSGVCGMQNGCFAVMTQGQIRTTHLTGISTDIGVDLARLWFGRLGREEREITQGINLCRFVTICAFTAGSILSVLATQAFEYRALAVVLATSSAVFLAVRRISAGMDRRIAVSAGERERRAVAEAV